MELCNRLFLLCPLLKSLNDLVARASAATRGVSFMFGRFFGRQHENSVFCEVFVNNTTFRCFRFPMLLFLFFGSVFCESVANTMLFVFCSILGSVAKFLSGNAKSSRFLHDRRVESQATSILK